MLGGEGERQQRGAGQRPGGGGLVAAQGGWEEGGVDGELGPGEHRRGGVDLPVVVVHPNLSRSSPLLLSFTPTTRIQ